MVAAFSLGLSLAAPVGTAQAAVAGPAPQALVERLRAYQAVGDLIVGAQSTATPTERLAGLHGALAAVTHHADGLRSPTTAGGTDAQALTGLLTQAARSPLDGELQQALLRGYAKMGSRAVCVLVPVYGNVILATPHRSAPAECNPVLSDPDLSGGPVLAAVAYLQRLLTQTLDGMQNGFCSTVDDGSVDCVVTGPDDEPIVVNVPTDPATVTLTDPLKVAEADVRWADAKVRAESDSSEDGWDCVPFGCVKVEGVIEGEGYTPYRGSTVKARFYDRWKLKVRRSAPGDGTMKSWIYVEGLWLGLNPFNADAIDLNSEFTMNCLIANVDISVPPSADIFGQVGDEHDPGGPVENTWHREYYSPDNEMSCNMPTSVAHEAKGIFTFWSYSVTARAYNSNSLL